MDAKGDGAFKGLDEVGILGWVDGALREVADEERRIVTSGYFPTTLEIIGVAAPQLRQIVREVGREIRGWEPGRVLGLSQALVDEGTHEGRQVAYELLERRKDARGLLKIRSTRRLGKGNDNWASVDAFGVMVAGPVWREEQIPDREVLGWAAAGDLWWRRTALVATVALNMRSRGGSGDADRTLMVCRALASDKEPMVAKALSWALRSLVSVHRPGVEGFLKERASELPSLVVREVQNKLSTGKKNP